MKQKFIRIEAYHFDDLTDKIQDKISQMNSINFYLKDFKFARMDSEENCQAFLLFEGA